MEGRSGPAPATMNGKRNWAVATAKMMFLSELADVPAFFSRQPPLPFSESEHALSQGVFAFITQSLTAPAGTGCARRRFHAAPARVRRPIANVAAPEIPGPDLARIRPGLPAGLQAGFPPGLLADLTAENMAFHSRQPACCTAPAGAASSVSGRDKGKNVVPPYTIRRDDR